MDRIRDAGYLDDLEARSTDDIRRMRDECEEEESGVSYARRLLQGKLDILRAEIVRRRDERAGNGDLASLLDSLPRILSDEVTSRPLRSRVTRFLVPPAAQHHRRDVERLSGGALGALADRSDDEVGELIRTLSEKEQELSSLRRELLDRIDVLQDELARRYKQGTADVAEVIPRRA